MLTMNGQELAGRVQRQRPDVPIVYASGYVDDVVAQQGVLEPGTLLITKPLAEEALTPKLCQALAQGQRERG